MARIYDRLQETSCGLKDEYIRPRAIPLYSVFLLINITPSCYEFTLLLLYGHPIK